MSGLEKIIGAIENEAAENAKKITDSANLRAEKIKAEGDKKAAEAFESSIAECRRQCDTEYENAQSAAQSLARRELLACRSELLDRAERLAAEKIKSMPDEEYFALILRLIAKCSRPSEGEVRFSAADLKRLPEDFAEKLNGFGAFRLKISPEPADIDGGFLISFGDITENCSISAVMEAERDSARDAAAAVLFARGDG